MNFRTHRTINAPSFQHRSFRVITVWNRTPLPATPRPATAGDILRITGITPDIYGFSHESAVLTFHIQSRVISREKRDCLVLYQMISWQRRTLSPSGSPIHPVPYFHSLRSSGPLYPVAKSNTEKKGQNYESYPIHQAHHRIGPPHRRTRVPGLCRGLSQRNRGM